MTLDSRMRSLATNLLQSYGKQVTFKRITQGEYDPTTGSVAVTTSSSTVHTILQNPDETQLASGQYRIDQVIAMLSAEELGFAPTPNDKITIDGSDWNISMVSFISSGEQNAVYNCIINK
jgi:hypothetical protein